MTDETEKLKTLVVDLIRENHKLEGELFAQRERHREFKEAVVHASWWSGR